MKRIGLILIIMFFPKHSPGGVLDDYAMNYLQRIENRNGAICYSRCSGKSDAQYSATIVVEIGTKKGLLIVMNRQTVINVATLSISSKGFHIEDSHGGGYSREKVDRLVKELSGKPFQLMTPMRIKQFEGKKAWAAYTNAP